MVKHKKLRVGIDLDGVIIDKPPIISRKLIEWLYRSHEKRKLAYRFPSNFEIKIRLLSHMSFLRPPIKHNLEFIKEYSKSGNKIYAISSRYSFLEKKTKVWIKQNGISKVFSEVYLNKNDEQPHIFKEKMLKKLKLDIFIDDDKALISYLKNKINTTKISLVTATNTLEKILK